MTDYDAIDLCAGPGGWDLAARRLGLHVLGVEQDPVVCATRRRADLPTVNADMTTLQPGDFYPRLTPNAVRGRGGIASPPCQGFSMAGRGQARQDSERLLTALRTVRTGEDVEALILSASAWMSHEGTALVLEPLRWALTVTPSWLAWEQVPAVLPIWEACAVILRRYGYTVATGVLRAEQYGVGQTRKRAILVARSPWMSRAHGPAHLPAPTHSRYHERTPARLDGGVLPWRSWGSVVGIEDGTLGFPRRADAGVATEDGYRARDFRAADLPSFAVTSKVRSWVLRGSNHAHASIRPQDRPAPTLVYGNAHNDVRLYPEGTTSPGVPEAAATRHPESRLLRVPEAAAIQTFPPDYPWAGSRSKQCAQIGDAVPPLLAEHVLSAATGLAMVSR